MGLSTIETAVICTGAALIVRFLLRTALPWARRGFLSAAERRSMDLREEFVSLPPSRIAVALGISGVLCAGTALAWTGSAAVAATAGFGPVFLSGVVVRRFRLRRKAAILARLPALLDLLAGHMKAGHSLQQSFAETEPLLPEGIREEMAWVLQQIRLGVPVSEALLRWEDRIGAEEVSLFVRPLRIALQGGGNVAELLERTRDILRMRARMREKLRSMTAQARLQAAVLTLLPPAFVAVLSRVDPGFLSTLLGTPHGNAILCASAVLLCIGWLIIRKILSEHL